MLVRIVVGYILISLGSTTLLLVLSMFMLSMLVLRSLFVLLSMLVLH